MPSAVLSTLLRLITVLVVAVGVLAFAGHAVPTGGPVDGAPSWAKADGGHGHSHDDEDSGGGRSAGHTHSHNPGDHSHDTLTAGIALRTAVDAHAGAWRRMPSDPGAGHAPGPLDRPPRSERRA